MSKPKAFVLLSVLLLLFAVWSLYIPYRPGVLGADAPGDQFAAGRAEVHLRTVARAPHPLGTEEHERVRRYVVEQIEALGLTAEIQATPYLSRLGQSFLGAHLENVLVRLPGREPGPTVLFACHYDSVPSGPGAGDDGAAVASFLETLRILSQGSQLGNDLVFLFSDGEELGLLGADVFQRHHPWAADVRLVVNFEARGGQGPVIMFETGSDNTRWVRELAATGVPVVAPSYSYEVYNRMPNITDFTIFKNAGRPGLNFAFIHGGVRYHTAQDSVENLDRRSLQQQGEIVLALARRLGESDLDAPPTGDAVYFSQPWGVVVYPAAWAMPLAVVLALAVVALLVLGFRRGRLRASGLLLAVVVLLLSGVLFGLLLSAAASSVSSGYNFILASNLSSHELVHLGLALAGAGLVLALYRAVRRFTDAEHLFGAALFLWLILAGFASAVAPGLSYLFALPLLAALPAAWLVFRSAAAEDDDEDGDKASLPLCLALAVPIYATAVLWTSTLALTGNALWPVVAGLTGFVLASALLGLLVPVLALADGRPRAGLVLAAALVVLGGVVIAATRGAEGFSESNPRPTSLFYSLDLETGDANWWSLSSAPDAWTRHVLGEPAEKGVLPSYMDFPRRVLKSAAPRADLAGARVRLLSTTEAEDEARIFRVEMAWPSPAHRALIFFRPQGRVRAVSHGDQRLALSKRMTKGVPSLTWYGPPSELVLDLELNDTDESAGTDAPLEIEIVSRRYELPELPGLPPRPADVMTSRDDWINGSTSVRSVTVLRPEDAVPEGDAPSSDAPSSDASADG